MPVIYVSGNHESYGLDIEKLEDQLRVASKGTQVRFLAKDRFDFNGVRFLGTSLWTDYALNLEVGQSIAAAMVAAGFFSPDHTEIRLNRREFSPLDALRRHEVAR